MWIDYCPTCDEATLTAAYRCLRHLHTELCVAIPQRVAAGHFCCATSGGGGESTSAQQQQDLLEAVAAREYQLPLQQLHDNNNTTHLERFCKQHHVGEPADLVERLHLLYGISITLEDLEQPQTTLHQQGETINNKVHIHQERSFVR